MQRRGGSEQPVKGQSANRPEASNAPTAQVSTADLQEQLDRRTRERDEALEQLAATSEVLQVISSSPGKLEPVFQAMLENALRICEAKFGTLYLCDGGALRPVADTHRAPLAYIEARKRKPRLAPVSDGPVGRVLITQQVVHIADLSKLQSYLEHHPTVVDAVELGGFRTALGVPMLRDNELIGLINIMRQEVRPFTDKQIKLVENFAAEAVIAIENARLLNEQRESLERQTATSEVLRVISSSPGELEPVFQAMLENATRICEAKIGILFRYNNGAYTAMAMLGVTPAYAEYLNSGPIRPGPTTGLGRVINTRQTIHIVDTQAEGAYADREPLRVATAELGGARTLLNVPMIKEGELIGAIGIYRQEVRPFTEKQIELVTNFAAQAVIAIENTRLLNELRQRTDDLSDALEQQTATSDVLKVISSSPGELEPVFQAMLENAIRICEAKFGLLLRFDGQAFQFAAEVGTPPALAEFVRDRGSFQPIAGSHLDHVMRTKQVSHTVDYAAEGVRAPPVTLGGARSTVDVPLLKDDELVGVFSIYRQEVRPFTEKQIELVKNFAAQAVIAIENTRLLNELRESLQQQTATADVLKVISRSTFNLQTVLDTLVKSATRLCDADHAWLFRREGETYKWAASFGHAAEQHQRIKDYFLTHPVPLGRGSLIGRIAMAGQAVHIPDVLADPDYKWSEAQQVGQFRTAFGVPLLREDETIGVLVFTRSAVRPFTEKQIELATTFADQAVIAIENVRLFEAEQQHTRELSEALEQQTATSEVLKVISSSPGELGPVFDAMLANATRICEAKFGVMYRYENDAFYPAAMLNAPPRYADFVWTRGRFLPQSGNALDLVLQAKQVIHSVDQSKERVPTPSAKLGGARSQVTVPMLKDGSLVGAIAVYRQEVRPFTDKQIELVKNFAAQAVIAIENTRLLSELRESLQQQTATADVLKVISRSTFDLQSVLNTLVESAVRLCNADIGHIARPKEGFFQTQATYGFSEELKEEIERTPFKPGRGSITARALLERKTVQILDAQTDPEYKLSKAQKIGGYRTMLGAPLLREGVPIGVFGLSRYSVRPFSDKQMELLATFADQAVIAIENVRLFDEVQARTRELSESLEQQTATSEVLQVISRSRGELESVFNAMLENAVRICRAKFGNLMLLEGDAFRTVALHDAPPEYAEARRREPLTRHRAGTVLGQVLATKRPAQIADVRGEPAYYEDPSRTSFLKLAGARTVVAVPMLKEDELVGAIFIYRQEVQPFTEKQIDLLENFASQAVIAIENTRLLNELRKSLQQQTATADVLKVISRSTFDLQTVLQTLVKSAGRLCEADKATITRQKGGVFYLAEGYGFSHEFMDYIRNIPIKPERGSAAGRSLLEGRVVHISDAKADPEYTMTEAQRLGDYRTVLAVPMLREGIPIGVLALMRAEVRPFTDKQIELVTTFADQAAIAIENVRLFQSVETRTRELAASLEDLRTTQDRLVQTQKLASLGQLTAGIAHEIKNPLNFVNNFSGVSAELIDELREALKDVSLNEKRRSEITELMDTLRGNLDKVVQHGKRADAIVKNMLLHSREGSGEHRVVDINTLVEESLNLAYHGARAEKQGFTITLERSLDPAAGAADVFPQDITRALLNLISNGFYAATKRKAETNGGDYEPTLTAATKNLGDRVEIRIRDNGDGIPPDVKEKMFTPFFTTKPAGEGTGLGLSISHDIIVKQHGGSIEVDTQPGKFTELRIVLPRAAVFLAEPGRRA